MNAMDIALFNLGVRPQKPAGNLSSARLAVLEVVRNADEPIHGPEVVKITGLNQSTVYTHLDRLARQGYIEKIPVHSHKNLWKAV